MDLEELRQVISAKRDKVQYTDVEGSPFFDDHFKDAKIKGIEGVWPVRYDAYRDEIEILKEKESFALTKSQSFNSIKYNDGSAELRLVNYSYKGDEIEGYLYEIGKDASFTLFKKKSIIFKQAKEVHTTLEIQMPHRFIQEKPVYFIEYDAKFIELDQKLKTFSKSGTFNQEEVIKCKKETAFTIEKENTILAFAKCITTK